MWNHLIFGNNICHAFIFFAKSEVAFCEMIILRLKMLPLFNVSDSTKLTWVTFIFSKRSQVSPCCHPVSAGGGKTNTCVYAAPHSYVFCMPLKGHEAFFIYAHQDCTCHLLYCRLNDLHCEWKELLNIPSKVWSTTRYQRWTQSLNKGLMGHTLVHNPWFKDSNVSKAFFLFC